MSTDEKKIPIVEMFGPTIQGEGAVIGMQTYFIRFGLCDFKCTMCDSMHAVDPRQVKANASWLTCDEIANSFRMFRDVQGASTTKNVTFSGGNPCIHDLDKLVAILSQDGYQIHVETQGTFSPQWLNGVDSIACSPKGPGMGENCDLDKLDNFLWRNRRKSYLKIVIFDQRDLEFAKMIYERYEHNNIPFYMSLGNPYPPGYRESQHPTSHADVCRLLTQRYEQLLEDIFTDPILSKVTFLPQWHVYVWGNQKGK